MNGTGGTMPKTLGEAIRRAAARQGDKVALRFGGFDITYRSIEQRIASFAAAVRDLGVQPGERVCFLGKNCSLYYEMLVGTTEAGAVMTPLNWRLSQGEIAWILNDAKARLLIVDGDFAAMAQALKAEVPGLAWIVQIDPMKPAPAADYIRPLVKPGSTPVPAAPIDGEDVALQIYTSGTTGRPKGAMLTHRSFMAIRALPPEQQPEWNRWTEDDVALIVNPVFHISGSGYGMQTLIVGATGFIAREFDAGLVLDLIESEGLSKVFVVPASMQMILRHPRAREVDYRRIKYMLYGASPMPVELLKEAMGVFKAGFVQMYGMTETSGTVVALEPQDHDLNRPELLRSAGKPMPGVEIVILGDDGKPVPTGAVGEIAVRSPTNMKGYWNMPEATRATIGADGFLRTGDAGFFDKDGFLYIHDRVKDMIISGGENIYPAEVENAVFGHEGVAEVAVIGVPSEKWGEEVKAIVVPKAGKTPSEADIIAWTRSRIATYKAPKSVDFVDAIPRNPSGKILRRELRDRYWAGHTRRVN
jgi:acyl-CoA synthetase (AMP-forming)/AMP-acid ligase II